MDIKLMKDFEELEGVGDENQEEDVVVEEDDDEEFRPAQANALSSADIFYEMEKRGLKSTGFPDTDIEMLQQAFNEEFERDMEDLKAKRLESKRRAAQQAGMQRRRKLMQQTLQEEQEELAQNRSLSLSLDRVQENSTPTLLRLDISSIGARSLAKAMWINENITSLDLSSNFLNDHAGKYLARILNRNNTILSMELDSNEFGPMTCRAFGESLKNNTSLKYLNLDSNPLLTQKIGLEQFKEFSDALSSSKTLTNINLHRCNITAEGGSALINALEKNDSILFLDIGHNHISMADQLRYGIAMDRNLKLYEKKMRQKEVDDAKQAAIDLERTTSAENERKDFELKKWLDEQRADRAQARRDEHDAMIAKKKQDAIEAAERAKAEAERKKKADEEAEAKKAKKGGKKKKK